MSKIDIEAADMKQFYVLISNRYIGIDSISKHNCMTNGINFYSKVDYILEFLKKRSSVCVWDVCQARSSRRRDAM